MESEVSIVMNAPVDTVFRLASNVEGWPRVLPHYRWVRTIEHSQRLVVRMAAWRGWIPIQWTSEVLVDESKRELRFRHLKAFTRGMRVLWTFDDMSEGTRVCIYHHLVSPIPVFGTFIAEHIIRDLFIEYIAPRTLRYMKQWVERSDEG